MDTPQPDLTHAEARDGFEALMRDIGPKCSSLIGLNTGAYAPRDQPLKAYIWLDSSASGAQQFNVTASTYRDLLAAAQAEWATRSDLHAVETIRRMALAIISITADCGSCSDAALRAQFNAADIKQYGDKACAQATEIASNGPFSIVSLSGANDVGRAA